MILAPHGGGHSQRAVHEPGVPRGRLAASPGGSTSAEGTDWGYSVGNSPRQPSGRFALSSPVRLSRLEKQKTRALS